MAGLGRSGALIATFAAAFLLACPIAASGQNADREIAAKRAAEQKTFTDKEIIDGFFKVTFGAELQFRGQVERIRKYDRPVRVFIENRAKPDRRAEFAGVIADIKARVQHLDIAVTEKHSEANVTVRLVRDRDLPRTFRKAFGRTRANRIMRSLDPQCLSGFRKDDRFRIVHSDVILAVDAGDFIFRDCAYEEMLQALGPINDTSSVPWTMFNDDVELGFFGVYDQHLLNILYDPRIEAGMTRAQVRALLPKVLPDVRAWVSRINNLQP
jgi:hypothetical protein